MIEIGGNLWNYFQQPFVNILITTNGTIKANGECVMGRGCAKEAKDRIPGIAEILGRRLRANGNKVTFLSDNIWSFPVKHNWWEKADIELIKDSAEQLAGICSDDPVPRSTWILPRPGCGNGHLSWIDVKPILEGILPDSVHVISF